MLHNALLNIFWKNMCWVLVGASLGNIPRVYMFIIAKFARRRSTFGERTNRRIGNIVMNIRFMINTNDFITVRYYYSLM
jgi:hypothetical protein